MEHQYPGAISGDEGMLAELMLPDQVHNRKEDWTMFFLHKDTSEGEGSGDEDEEESKTALGDNPDRHDDDNTENERDRGSDLAAKGEPEDSDDAEGGEGPPLIYVLNLVNTKHDASVKRFVQNLQILCPHEPLMRLSRGAVVKAMAICTRHPFLHIYKVL